jgi:PAS domain S-box-containing protein
VDALKTAAGILGAAIQRQKAESAVHESEQIYRQAIQASGAIPYFLDFRSQSYTFMGENVEELTGYPPSELTPQLWEQMEVERIPRGRMAHLTYEEADQLTKQGLLRHWECDYLIVNRQGKERWVSDSCIHVLNERSERIGSVGILQDITDRKAVEFNLRQREMMLKAATFAAEQFLNSPDWQININDVLERLGKTFQATHVYLFEHSFGTDEVEYSSLKYEWTRSGYASDFDNPEYQSPTLVSLDENSTDQALRNNRVFAGNTTTFPPAEKERLVSMGVKSMLEVPLFLDGKWWGTFGLDDYENEREWSSAEVDALKVTTGILAAAIQRQKAESTVRESERIYRQAIEAAGAVPYYQDYAVDKYRFMGQGIQKITGYRPEEMSSSLWNSIVLEQELIGELAGLDTLDAAKRIRNGEFDYWKCDYKILSRDGKLKWVADTAIELFDRTGISYGSIGIMQDITDRKLIEARLRKREMMLEATTFAAEQFLKSSNWRTVIDEVLERLGRELNVSHAYLFERHEGPDGKIYSSMRNEWTAPGFTSDLEDDSFQNIEPNDSGYEIYYNNLDQGLPLVGSSSSFTEKEKDYWNSLGVKALLEMRIIVNGQQWGVIGFDEMEKDRDWTPSEVDVIKVAASVMSAAIERQLDEDTLKNELAERKRVEQALRFSEEKFSKAFQSTQVLLTIEDENHRFIDANKAFEDAFGLSREDIIGHNASELNIFYSFEDTERLRENLQKANGILRDYEIPFRRRNGEKGYALFSSEKIKLDNIEYFLTSGLDITERKRAEERYRSIFNNSIDGIFQSTIDGHFIDVNAAMARIYGYDSPEDMLNTIKDVRTQVYADAAEGEKARQRLNSGEKLTGYETMDRRKDGSLFWSSMNAQAIYDEAGNVLYYEGTLEDITPRKMAEAEREKLIEELAEKNAEAETLRETTSIITSTLNANEIIQRILEQIKRVIPYDSASVWLYEGNVARLVGSDGLPGLMEIGFSYISNESEPDYQFLSHGVPYILIDDVQEKFPQFREYPSNYIHGWLSVVLITRGRIVGFISLDSHRPGRFSERHAHLALNFANQVSIALENARLFADAQNELDERKKLIDELANKNAELEQFTYTVSHDLKSPLVTISGFLGYLEQDAAAGNMDRMKKDTQRIHEAVRKMQRLLNELLELSRIGRMMNTPEAHPFDEMVEEALSIVHGRLEKHGVKVSIQSGLPIIYGDRPRLVEVIQNLLDNAAKYMGDQVSPHIEVGQRGEENGSPVFFVKDNGIGIEREHHERIFGLFNKLDASSEGTGVGLALVKRIIEFHSGRIWVESETGKGSTFYFTLPLPPVKQSV